jgi:GntR family transcriptional regulator, transcriptional repressor for pyruvate dehydrogenase complex
VTQPERQGAAERIIDEVRGLIERGELRSGDQLPPERELARRYGISRPSVRSGLKALAAMGIVQIRQGAGTFIRSGPPTLESQPLDFLAALHGFSRAQMLEARLVLEVTVAGLAAQRTRSAPELVIAIGDETTGMFASMDDTDQFLEHEIRFHRAIATASANPILASLVEMVSKIFQEFRRKTISRAHDLKQAAEEHLAIYHAVRDHDVDGARDAMQRHLLRASRELPDAATEPGGENREGVAAGRRP